MNRRDASALQPSSPAPAARLGVAGLRWAAVLTPVLVLVLLELAHRWLAPSAEPRWLLVAAALLMACIYGWLFISAETYRQQLQQRNHELEALHSAGLDMVSELALGAVLQKVVDCSRALLGTRYGALAVYDEEGHIHEFVTSGMDAETAGEIGRLPTGEGLLGIVLREGQRLRLDELSRDPRSGGFPDNHPEMRSLLAVPLICRSPCRGNLYLTDKQDSLGFSADDEEVLTRFATQAAIAVDNAYLYAQVEGLAVTEERLMLARELHDGQAQVLAFVNAKAQAARELQRAGRSDEAGVQLEQLAAAAREVSADLREGILGLRATVDTEQGLGAALRQHLERWQDQSGIVADVEIGELPRLRTEVELQVLRILQEALANVRKHAAANRVQVVLQARDHTMVARVQDDGVGFDPQALGRARRPRFGLATMRERAEVIDGQLSIRSEPGQGTTVSLELPCSDHDPVLSLLSTTALHSAQEISKGMERRTTGPRSAAATASGTAASLLAAGRSSSEPAGNAEE